jgi:hypothetical protein
MIHLGGARYLSLFCEISQKRPEKSMMNVGFYSGLLTVGHL